MRKIEESLEKYKELLEKIGDLKEEIEKLAKSQGYDFDAEKGCLTKNADEIYVMDIYIRSKSTYESSGKYSAYAGLIQMSEEYFEDIKDKITNDKEDWEEILQSDFFFDDKSFDNFRNSMFWIDYISKEMITSINLDKDTYDLREGVIEFYGEAYFKGEHDDFCDGYICIMKMNKEIYEKNKHEEFFHNTKYLALNSSHKYKVW